MIVNDNNNDDNGDDSGDDRLGSYSNWILFVVVEGGRHILCVDNRHDRHLLRLRKLNFSTNHDDDDDDDSDKRMLHGIRYTD